MRNRKQKTSQFTIRQTVEGQKMSFVGMTGSYVASLSLKFCFFFEFFKIKKKILLKLKFFFIQINDEFMYNMEMRREYLNIQKK